jgi:hypothetical protein
VSTVETRTEQSFQQVPELLDSAVAGDAERQSDADFVARFLANPPSFPELGDGSVRTALTIAVAFIANSHMHLLLDRKFIHYGH